VIPPREIQGVELATIYEDRALATLTGVPRAEIVEAVERRQLRSRGGVPHCWYNVLGADFVAWRLRIQKNRERLATELARAEAAK